METSFKASKKTKYFQIDYVTGLEDTPVQYHKHVWCLNKEHAKAFIKRVKEIETHVKEILLKDELSYDFRLIISLHLEAIENISCGLDLRSKMTSEDLADRFVYGYHKKYQEAHTFCKDTLEFFETEGKLYTYCKNWRRYDKHNDLVREFRLPFKKLGWDDFHVDHLKNMAEAMEKLDELIEERRNMKNNLDK
jgi:hypothetical protein